MHKNILLAMDNVLMMSSLMTSIATLVSEAVTHPVGDTEEIADFLNKNEPPSLIILDMEMRDNKGRAILEFLASRKIKIPLIIMNDSGKDLGGISAAGRFDKPLNYRALYGTIKKVLEKNNT
ncbi:MAG: hypothetical protein Q8R31_00260 [Candidatus Omnitrophota bacterium]|nr:hypothetical protein [Candidatus Omnitrophota bacterium]